MIVVDLAGKRFDRITILSGAGSTGAPGAPGRRKLWLCRCDCGQEFTRTTGALRRSEIARAASCGCERAERIGQLRRTHGARRNPAMRAAYEAWTGMKKRCYNQRTARFPHYGGRGIVVCERWREDFAAFFEDMGQKPSPAHSLDRIDVNGPYSPENCRWASSAEQARNRTDTVWITVAGERLCVADAAAKFDLPATAVAKRLKRGWSDEEAVLTPLRKDRPDYKLHHHRWQK